MTYLVNRMRGMISGEVYTIYSTARETGFYIHALSFDHAAEIGARKLGANCRLLRFKSDGLREYQLRAESGAFLGIMRIQ